MSEPLSLQERYAPNNACFGCGPKNHAGLRVRSFPEGDELVCEWQPQAHHEAFPGILNGGIAGSLLDCHMNWTAMWHLMRRDRLPAPPCTVTADYHVKLRRPTPTAGPLKLRARAVDAEGDKVIVEGSIEAEGKVCVTCRGTFVAVQPGHPAYHGL